MELDLFLKGLESSLRERGIPPEAAAKHVSSLSRTFTEDDLAEIKSVQSQDEIDEIADSIAAILYKSKPPKPAPVSSGTDAGKERSSAGSASVREPARREVQHEPVPETRRQPSPPPKAPQRYVQNSDDFFTTSTRQDTTPRGVAIFWAVLILTLPLTLGLLLGVLAVFGAMFVGLIVCIIGLVCAMIAIVAAGAGISLIGIIYGITQLFSVTAFGLYEIGLGVIVAGGVLLVGVLLYNIAIRFLPWVMQWLTVFFLFVCRQCRNLFYLARRECYKL